MSEHPNNIHTSHPPLSPFKLTHTNTHWHTRTQAPIPPRRQDMTVLLYVCNAPGSLLVVVVIQSAVMRSTGANRLQALWDRHA
ncbi:hypothetical protein EXN66_Car012365 [Channa argus]|uniref:Uncharacterized protein n=1 Tax=Channa argus TaxID=215402 RepID=A0A6G1Q2G1_CHAAH|nr:hypothetical protein EXN66_Car012365 [Channa argus]